MKPLEHYLQKVAAIPAKPVLVAADIGLDDLSVRWEAALELRAAEAGDVTAQLNIAREYAEGKDFGTPADAAIWFRRAAEQGSAEGAWRLGHLYATGEGVDQDLAEARRWIWRAAE